MKDLFGDARNVNETQELIDRVNEIQYQMIEAVTEDYEALKLELDDILYLLEEQGAVV